LVILPFIIRPIPAADALHSKNRFDETEGILEEFLQSLEFGIYYSCPSLVSTTLLIICAVFNSQVLKRKKD
jgi:hypothetical protein